MAELGLRIGISLVDPKPGPDPLGELENQIRRAADDGFASAWLANIFALDALTALAVAGRNVPGIELGTAVVPDLPETPAALAQQALTAHLALGERLVLGVGTSHKMVVEGSATPSIARPGTCAITWRRWFRCCRRAGAMSRARRSPLATR